MPGEVLGLALQDSFLRMNIVAEARLIECLGIIKVGSYQASDEKAQGKMRVVQRQPYCPVVILWMSCLPVISRLLRVISSNMPPRPVTC